MRPASKPGNFATTGESVREGWEWVALLASFLTNLLTVSVGYNVGVLNVAVSDRFPGASVGTVSWLMAIYSSLFALAAPLGSAVINLTTCRVCVCLSGLCAFLGLLASSFVTQLGWFFPTLILAGLAQSLSLLGSTVILVYYFPTRTALANGIAKSGSGVGSFVHPALLQMLLDEYTLDGAFLILSAVSLNACMLGLLMHPTARELRQHQEKRVAGSKQRSAVHGSSSPAWRRYLDILTDARFAKVLVAVFTFAAAFQSTIIYMPEYLIMSKGFTRLEAATVASFVGMGTLFSRPLVGFAATDIGIGEVLMFVGLNFVSFLVCMAADFLMGVYASACVVSLSLGLYTSSCNVLVFPIVIRVLGCEKGASGYGIVMMVFGVGSLVGPPCYALVLQKLGYWVLFRLSGVLFLLAAAISIGTFRQTPPLADDECHGAGPTVNQIETLMASQNFELFVSAEDAKDTDHDESQTPLKAADGSVA